MTAIATFGVAGCIDTAGKRDAAVAAAQSAFQNRFPQEYNISKWEVIADKAGDTWHVMFTHPMAEHDKAILGDIPRMGRMFILSEDGRRVLDTLIAQ